MNKFVNINSDPYNTVWLTIECNMTYYTIKAEENNTFALYDVFTVNIDTPDVDYTQEDLLGHGFAQPDYAFIIDNDSEQISLKMNCDKLVFELSSDKNERTWTYCTTYYSEELYNQIKTTLKDFKVSEEKVKFNPYNSWITYNCTKTIYEF